MKNKKELGQNWLKNRAILNEIADLATETGVENCLEIGPGLGFLTSSLLRRFKKVVAVEFDSDLAKNLPGSFPGTNLDVKNADILEYDFSKMEMPYNVAGNIPYYITSPILRKILTLEKECRPRKAVLLVQKEVAERVAVFRCKRTFLAILVENYAEVSLGPVVLRGEFTPPPKVDSQVLILNLREKPLVSEEVLKLVKVGFSSPRKKLVANLVAGLAKIDNSGWSAAEIREILAKNEINIDARPADLTIFDWEKVYLEVKKK